MRLQQTRWPPPIDTSDWSAGTDSSYLRALAEYWASDYNWRERETKINRFHRFLADVRGTTIHFIKAGFGSRSHLATEYEGELTR